MWLWRPRGLPKHFYDFYIWRPGITGLYESNYIKANSRNGELALWIKHNILAPKDPQLEPIVELWCALFQKGKKPIAVKKELPASKVSLERDFLSMRGPDILLTEERTATHIKDGVNSVSWDIQISKIPHPMGSPLVHFPYSGFYRWPFPKKKLLTPAPLTRWNGILTWNGKEIPIRDWIGFRNHNWGTEHAKTYAYGNCNFFDEIGSEIIFDGFSAKIGLGPVTTPFLSMAVVRNQFGDLAFNSLYTAISGIEKVSFPRWELQLRNDIYTLTLSMEADPSEFIGLLYRHPDGKLSYCYNTKWAKTKLSISLRNSPPTVYTSQFGELEFLFSQPLEGIPLYKSSASPD